MYEQALAAVPTARMFSMYATYLQDMLAQSSQPQQEKLSEGQVALVGQLLQLCKRAFHAGWCALARSVFIAATSELKQELHTVLGNNTCVS